MKLIDIVPYYLGCKCVNNWFPENHELYNNNWQLASIDINSPKPYRLDTGEDYTWTDSIKLILRKIEDMNNEEKNEYHSLVGETTDGVHVVVIRHDVPASFHWLLKNGFDLFDLIENGLAIDSKTLK